MYITLSLDGICKDDRNFDRVYFSFKGIRMYFHKLIVFSGIILNQDWTLDWTLDFKLKLKSKEKKIIYKIWTGPWTLDSGLWTSN